MDLRGVGEKVRKLIDDHIQSQGVEVKVEPISILDVKFDDAVNRHVSDRAKASEMEHALRAHIRQHFEEDPVLYQRLSERLEQVLTAMKDNWVEIIKAWRAMMEAIRHEGGESSYGLDPRTQAPFVRVVKHLPATKDAVAADPKWPAAYTAFVEQMKFAKGRGPNPEWPQISKAISGAMQQVLTAQAEPAAAMAAAAATVAKLSK